ncbi:NfeD family protein [Paludisphaera sp.]|uniref:NfeD family protein n=1 Tax=Paludisphaera sp. TaxID=2017432 RepID=UPI00301C4BF5
MKRAVVARHALASVIALMLTTAAAMAQALDAAAPAGEATPGQFFTVTEPITHEQIAQVRARTRHLVDQASRREGAKSPILVFQFLPGESAPGSSDFGAAYDLANYIARDLGGARLTVAYVPKPLTGFAVLPALACTEIVMGSQASLGPITPETQSFDPALREPVRFLAVRKARDADLILGMLDRDADLRLVRTADRGAHYVMAENLDEFRSSRQVVDDKPAWEGGRRGVLTAERARDEGFAKRLAETPAEVAAFYRIAGQSTLDDPTLGQLPRPVWIKIEGPIEPAMVSYLGRRIGQARREAANLVFFEIDSPGGLIEPADAIADLIAGVQDMKTVAYVNERALGVAALLPLACRDIVFAEGGRLGDVDQLVTGRGALQPLSEAQIDALAEKAAFLASRKGHSPDVARALVDPAVELVDALDSETGATRPVARDAAEADRDRFKNIVARNVGAEGPLLITAADAESFGMGQVVRDLEELKALHGLQGVPIRVEGPTWVDELVTTLTDPYVSWLLLFVGLFMMVLELKLPGIGLPAITSALAFMLFFWSHYLGGTADQLEIILFLLGLLALAIELFVLPGFGVFGMAGIALMLVSIVMASHTFVWPTQEYEYREMGITLIQLTGALLGVTAGAVVLAHYLPGIPIFNRLILKPEPWDEPATDPTAKPSMEGYESLAFLIGETGRTTSPLRPTGKARFGNLLIDVTADNFYIEPDSLVEVVDVHGTRVIVKPWSGEAPADLSDLDTA